MKKTLKILGLILISSALFTSCGSGRNSETLQVNTDQTDSGDVVNRINIPGTHILIIQPKGFSIAENFAGLKKKDGSTIQIFDLWGGNFYANEARLNAEKFEINGTKVLEFKDTTLNNYTAKFISLLEDAKTKGFIMVFGDSKFSSMIRAFYPTKATESEKQIKDAIFSVIYDKNIQPDPPLTEGFVLNDSVSTFKFARASSGLFFYSLGGVNKSNYKNEPFITASSQIPEGKNAKEILKMMIRKLEDRGLTEKKVINKSAKSVNGYPAYELEMVGKLKNIQYNFYYFVAIHSGRAIVIQARFNDSIKEVISEIKKLSHTVRIQ